MEEKERRKPLKNILGDKMNRGIYSLFLIVILCVGFVVTAQACTVTIDELALWAGGTIGTGTGVTISGSIASASGININNGSSLNSIYTQGSVWLGKSVTVTGDIVANGQVDTAKSAVITGSSSSYSNFVLPQLDYLQQTTAGTTSVYAAANSSQIITPGQYSSWSLSSSTTVTISSGTYSLSSFWIGSNSVVNVDTSAGDVILNVAGSFSAASGVSFVTSGSGNLYINVFNSDAWLDNNVSLTGVLKVFGGGLSTGTSVDLIGSFYATGNIYLGNDSQVTYVSQVIIPEPASLVLFAAVSLIFILKARRPTNTSAAVS